MSIARTTIVDDDGTLTTGTIWNNAWKTELYDQIDARWSEATTTATGTQNNLSISEADTFRANNATALTITGLVAPATPAKPGKPLRVVAIGAGTVTLNNEDAGSTAANRIITGTGAALTLAAGTGWALLVYDDTSDRWRVLGSSVDTAAQVVQTTTSTGTQNDFALTASCAVLRCNNASDLTITGMSAGQDGQRLTVISIGAGHVKFSHQAAGSTAANRLINTATSGITPIAAGKGSATYVYDATTARWRLVQHFQGSPITVAYTSTDFTADAGTWTVDSGDLITFQYYLTGNAMQVTVVITNSTTSGVNIGLFILIPNGYTISSVVNDIASVTPVGVGAAGVAQINNGVSTTKIRVLKIDFSAWANGTNNNGLSFTLNFPVD
jgi:hypothetical protein